MLGAAVATAALGLVQLADGVVICQDGGTCPDGNTCCGRASGGFGCCVDEESGPGVCCADGNTCCAHGYTCQPEGCVADDAAKHPLATRTNLYQLCPAEIPAAPHELSLPNAGRLSLPYYSSPKQLGAPNPAAKIGVIVVHGSERNADDYFCSMLEARKLQKVWPDEQVMIVAPRFTEPRDLNGSHLGWLTWNGTGYGDWRKGGNSTLAPGRASLSSYEVLDGIVAMLSDSHLVRASPPHMHFLGSFKLNEVAWQYPAMEHIVIVGHSAGGQTVQRYALTAPHAAPAAGPKVAPPPVRYVVANPSSFGYLNASRWTDTALPKVPSAPAPSLHRSPLLPEHV